VWVHIAVAVPYTPVCYACYKQTINLKEPIPLVDPTVSCVQAAEVKVRRIVHKSPHQISEIPLVDPTVLVVSRCRGIGPPSSGIVIGTLFFVGCRTSVPRGISVLPRAVSLSCFYTSIYRHLGNTPPRSTVSYLCSGGGGKGRGGSSDRCSAGGLTRISTPLTRTRDKL